MVGAVQGEVSQCLKLRYYLGKLASPDTINTVPEKTLLAFADHGNLEDLLEPDYAAAEQTVAVVAAKGIDVDALGQSLQRQGAKAFGADWAALLEAIDLRVTRIRSAV
jgi:transaldolase